MMGEGVLARVAIVACLGFSGFSALVYQVLWTRLLGFAFGTTTEAIGAVLAVFFGGLALGNLLAARRLSRLRRPLAVYARSARIGGALASLRCSRGRVPRWRAEISRRSRVPRCGSPRRPASCSCPPPRWAPPCRWWRAAWSRRTPVSGAPAPSCMARTRSAPSSGPICAASG
jgi:hypothetical protein